MKVTEVILVRLRKMINDVIVEDDPDFKPGFSDDELKMIIEESNDIYQAAAEVWLIKASLLQGEIESYSAGNEKYDMTPLKDRLDHALRMVSLYEGKVCVDKQEAEGSVMLKFKTPDVL